MFSLLLKDLISDFIFVKMLVKRVHPTTRTEFQGNFGRSSLMKQFLTIVLRWRKARVILGHAAGKSLKSEKEWQMSYF